MGGAGDTKTLQSAFDSLPWLAVVQPGGQPVQVMPPEAFLYVPAGAGCAAEGLHRKRLPCAARAVSDDPCLQRDDVGVGKLAVVHKHSLNRKVGRGIGVLSGVDCESVVRSAVVVVCRPVHAVGPVRVAAIRTHHPTIAMHVVSVLGYKRAR